MIFVNKISNVVSLISLFVVGYFDLFTSAGLFVYSAASVHLATSFSERIMSIGFRGKSGKRGLGIQGE